MATYKRVEGDYNIISVEDNDNVIIDTHTVKVYGNLDVLGNVTYIETTDLKVDDPFITVAANNTGVGSAAAFPQQGLITQTGSASFAGLRFNNDTNTWQISINVSPNGLPNAPYLDIVTTSTALTPGAPEQSVQFNVSNVFTGSANFLFDSGNAKLTLTGHEVFGNIGTAPAAVANAVALYHNAQGTGGTGLYFKSLTTEDELVSRKQAIVFGLIF